MPIKKENYPDDWKQIAKAIKEAVDWECQECGQQCRKPGEPYDTMRRTLTVAHYDNEYKAGEIFVVALCVPCHLRHDGQENGRKRRAFYKRHHLPLLPLDGGGGSQ